MDREAWQATVHGVAESQTRLTDQTTTLVTLEYTPPSISGLLELLSGSAPLLEVQLNCQALITFPSFMKSSMTTHRLSWPNFSEISVYKLKWYIYWYLPFPSKRLQKVPGHWESTRNCYTRSWAARKAAAAVDVSTVTVHFTHPATLGDLGLCCMVLPIFHDAKHRPGHQVHPGYVFWLIFIPRFYLFRPNSVRYLQKEVYRLIIREIPWSRLAASESNVSDGKWRTKGGEWDPPLPLHQLQTVTLSNGSGQFWVNRSISLTCAGLERPKPRKGWGSAPEAGQGLVWLWSGGCCCWNPAPSPSGGAPPHCWVKRETPTVSLRLQWDSCPHILANPLGARICTGPCVHLLPVSCQEGCSWDFPGGPVVNTSCLKCRGHVFASW